MADASHSIQKFADEVKNIVRATQEAFNRTQELEKDLPEAEKTNATSLPGMKLEGSIPVMHQYLNSDEFKILEQKLAEQEVTLQTEVMFTAAMPSQKFTNLVNKDGILSVEKALCQLLITVATLNTAEAA